MAGFGSWFVLLACTVVVGALIIGAVRSLTKQIEPLVVAFVVSVIATAAALASSEWYEFPDPPNKLYVEEDGQLVEKPWGAFHGFFEERKMAWLPHQNKKFAVWSSVTPITANPKVTKISYTLQGHIVDGMKFLSAPERRHLWIDPEGKDKKHVRGSVQDLIQYCAYEFNNSHSAALAKFYNPLDNEQQKKFRGLVVDYYDACLADSGVRVAIVDDFNIN